MTAGRNRVQLSTIILYGLFFVLMAIVIANKENYHEDEMYSYGLSNHHGSIVMSFEDGRTYEPSVEPYLDYLTVKDGYRFDYKNVWENQANDVHPPLYYALLHTICSLWPGMFSKWYAGGINMVFALLTLLVLEKLTGCLTSGDGGICTITSIFFVLSPGILSSISFFRMYVLAMFWVTCLTVLLVREVGEWRFEFWFYGKLFLIAVLGALTHYYCIIYTVFACAVFCCFLLWKKRWIPVGRFILTGGLAGGTAWAVFPSMTDHMFSGYRGVESINNLKQPLHEFWMRVKMFFSIMDTELFGCTVGFLVLAVVAAMVIGKITRRRKISDEAKLAAMRYLVVVIPVILYFFFVSKSATFISDRYMFPIYGIVFAGITSLVVMAVKQIFSEKTMILVVVAALSAMTARGWKYTGWQYLYKESAVLLKEAEKYRDVDCLYLYDSYGSRWSIQRSFMEVQNYKSVTFIQYEDPDVLTSLELLNRDQLIVVVDHPWILGKVMENCSQMNGCQEIGSYGYAATYYLYME